MDERSAPEPVTTAVPSIDAQSGSSARPRTLTIGLVGLLVTVVLAPVQLVVVVMAAAMATNGFEGTEPEWMDAARQSFWLPAVIGGVSVLLMAYGIGVWFVRDARATRARRVSRHAAAP